MTFDLTPEDVELLRHALDNAVRDARQNQAIYGANTRERTAALKALRSKLCGAPSLVALKDRRFTRHLCIGGIGDKMVYQSNLELAECTNPAVLGALMQLEVGASHEVCGPYDYYVRTR